MAKIIKGLRINKNLFKFTGNLCKTLRGRYKHDASIDLPHPTTLMLELTNKCNLRCITCPREHDYGKKMDIGNMDTSLAKEIVDHAYPYLQSIGLTGMGETLFAPNLKEVAAYIKSKKKDIVIFISTNANFADFTDRIKPVMPYLDTIQISIDGVGEGYELIRKGGSFELLEKNITELESLVCNSDIDIMLNMVITKENFMMMSDVIRFADRHNIKYINFNYFNLASVTDTDTSYYDFYRSKEYGQVLAKTMECAREFPDIEITGLELPTTERGRKACPLIWNHFQINHDGEVPPCCAKPFPKEATFGNVNGRSIREVINSEQARNFRAAWINGTPPAFCEKCHFIHLY